MHELLTRKFGCPDWNWRDRVLKADKNNSESFMYEDVSGKKIQSLKNPWGLCICLFIYYRKHWQTFIHGGCLLGHNRKQ